MDFQLAPEEERFRKEVHDFLEREELTQKANKERESGVGAGPSARRLWIILGEKGWLCPHWPKEYGGLGLPQIYRDILEEEYAYFDFYTNFTAARMVGPVLIRYGNEWQKKEFLPRIARGEIDLALGYTEPQAGSDIASIEMRAEDKGDYFLVNGQKMFNSGCHFSEYHWLLARTDINAPKHKGLSFFIVDLKTPGITLRPLYVLGGSKSAEMRTSEVFYDDVKVSAKYLVGQKNRGFYMLMEGLAFERMSPASGLERKLNALVECVRQTGRGRDPIIRQRVADLRIDIAVLKLLAMKISWMAGKRLLPEVEAALAKTLMTRCWEKLANLNVDVLGFYGILQQGSKYAPAEGKAEWQYRNFLYNRITRGTPEIMWNIVAQRGLGLPREH